MPVHDNEVTFYFAANSARKQCLVWPSNVARSDLRANVKRVDAGPSDKKVTISARRSLMSQMSLAFSLVPSLW